MNEEGFKYVCPLKRNSTFLKGEERQKLFDKEEVQFFLLSGESNLVYKSKK